MFGDMNLSCCICGVAFSATVRNSFCGGKGHFYEAVCTKACLDEKKWRETLSIMGKEYCPDPRKAEVSPEPSKDP